MAYCRRWNDRHLWEAENPSGAALFPPEAVLLRQEPLPSIEEIVTLQPRGSKAKVYQVKQVRKLINKYRLASDGEDE